MTTSQTANSALLRSLERARDRQARIVPASSSRQSTRPADNMTTIETITTGPNGEQKIERRVINNVEQVNPKPLWNSSKVAQPTKTPRSVFLDGNRPADNVVSRQVITTGPPMETTSPVKVVRLQPPHTEESYRTTPTYSQPRYPANTQFIRTDPGVVVLESHSNRRSLFNCFRRKKKYHSPYSRDEDILLNSSTSSVSRCCKWCARGRLASACPSCYFCELFYGCPLYCWLLTFLLLLLPALALFAWLLSEQPALNPAKRQYITQQTSIVQKGVYGIMRKCAVPFCTFPTAATTVNVLYQTYYYYAATQVTSQGTPLQTFSFFLLGISYLLYLNMRTNNHE